MINKRLAFIVLLLLMLSGIFSATAQDVTAPVAQDGFSIHVVQRDETLFQIAQQYGASLDALTRVNSITDPDKLQIGQRLIIPGERLPTGGLLTPHVVEPGETLFTIAERYNSTAESLSQVNNIFSASSLYVGETIMVTQGANGVLPSPLSSVHIVQAGDHLWRLSLLYQIPLRQLVEVNELDFDIPLQVGQRLIIPGTDAASRFVSLPVPMTDFRLSPLPAEQGRSLGAYIALNSEATIQGRIFDRDVKFARVGDGYFAMIGIHSFTETGIYPLTLTITDAGGTQTMYESRIQIQGGGYSSETIDIPPERQGLLAPAVVQAELERVEGIMSGYTDQKFFDGLMNLPSTGPVTSQYGTRRSYNGSPFDTFHGGADFGGAEGSPVMAAADGVVVLAEPLQVRGNVVIIDHGWGVYTGYWHNSQILVQANQFVTRGQVIANLGATGLVTGAHLHWEMWVGGVQVDPLQWAVHAFDDFGLAETEVASTQ